jgi:hypothetical protein
MNETPISEEKETSEEKWFIDKTGHFKKVYISKQKNLQSFD